MKNDILSKALKVLEQRRVRADIEQAAHMDEIYQKLPQVIDVRKELALTSVRLTKLILSKETDISHGLEKLKESNLNLQKMEKELLISGGYPADYLEVHPVCSKCRDTGYVGKERCSCLSKLMRQINIEAINGVSALKLSDFSSFDLRYYSDEMDTSARVVPRQIMSDIYAFCQKYAENFTPQMKGIFMVGETGLGKTHLSLAIAKKVIEKEYTVAYGSVQDFLRTIEAEHFGRAENNDTLNALLEVDLLILDDLGAEFISQFNLSAVYNLINTRCNRGKPTIINTNLTSKELEDRYSRRLVSRLFSLLTYLRFVGKDIRQIKANEEVFGKPNG